MCIIKITLHNPFGNDITLEGMFEASTIKSDLKNVPELINIYMTPSDPIKLTTKKPGYSYLPGYSPSTRPYTTYDCHDCKIDLIINNIIVFTIYNINFAICFKYLANPNFYHNRIKTQTYYLLDDEVYNKIIQFIRTL